MVVIRGAMEPVKYSGGGSQYINKGSWVLEGSFKRREFSQLVQLISSKKTITSIRSIKNIKGSFMPRLYRVNIHLPRVAR